jgi:hypothetical protein
MFALTYPNLSLHISLKVESPINQMLVLQLLLFMKRESFSW